MNIHLIEFPHIKLSCQVHHTHKSRKEVEAMKIKKSVPQNLRYLHWRTKRVFCFNFALGRRKEIPTGFQRRPPKKGKTCG